jgi:hypothetical protein
VKEREEEIAQLRKHLADYTAKVTELLFMWCCFPVYLLTTNNPWQEAQILSDKYMLEKRISYMRMVSVCVFWKCIVKCLLCHKLLTIGVSVLP